jgi:hypothetical protein
VTANVQHSEFLEDPHLREKAALVAFRELRNEETFDIGTISECGDAEE